MGFKPITKYFPASRISKEKHYNILAFMGFKPMTSITKYFLAYEISEQKALKIQALMGFKPMSAIINIFQLKKHQKRALKSQAQMGFKPMTKYFAASEIAKMEAFKILKESLWNNKGQSLQHSGFYGIQTHDLCKKMFFRLMKYQEKSLQIQAFMGFKPMSAIKYIFHLNRNIKTESPPKKGFDGIQTHDKIFSSFQNSKEESL